MRKKPISRITCLQAYYEIDIIRQFPFSSQLQRMSVITHAKQQQAKDDDGQPREHYEPMEVFVKGSPEMVMSLSRSDTGW